MKRPVAWMVVVALACLGMGCHADITSLSVPLKYHPTDNSGAGGLSAPSSRVYIAAVEDRRSDTSRIGENREDKPIPILAGKESPADFVADVVAEEFRNDGINVVDTPDAADRIVKIGIQRFWVTEANTYEAQVTLVAQVTDKAGNVLLTGAVGRGDDSTFGRSLSVENYQQVLSNATAKAINYLVSKPDFEKALSTANGG